MKIFLVVSIFSFLIFPLVIAGKVIYIYIGPYGTPLAESDVQGNLTATFDYRPYGVEALDYRFSVRACNAVGCSAWAVGA